MVTAAAVGGSVGVYVQLVLVAVRMVGLLRAPGGKGEAVLRVPALAAVRRLVHAAVLGKGATAVDRVVSLEIGGGGGDGDMLGAG